MANRDRRNMRDSRTIGIPKKKLGLSGVFEEVFRDQAWASLNLEATAFGTLPSYPWDTRKELYVPPLTYLNNEEEEV